MIDYIDFKANRIPNYTKEQVKELKELTDKLKVITDKFTLEVIPGTCKYIVKPT